MHIRFKRALKSEKRGVTPRRLAAAKRTLKRQAAEWAQGMRDHDAESWRKARAQLRSLPREEQEVVLTFWNKSSMPANASYFATVMHNYIEQDGSLIHG